MVKKKKEELGQSKQKSRAKYKCPENLYNLIYWANLISLDLISPDLFSSDSPLPMIAGFSDFFDVFMDKMPLPLTEPSEDDFFFGANIEEYERMVVWELLIHSVGKHYRELIVELFNAAFARLGKTPTNTLEEAVFLPEIVDNFIRTYTDLRNAIIKIIEIAKKLNEIREGNKDKSSLQEPCEPAFFYINENNKIDVRETDFLLKVLRGIDPDRLRFCKVCNQNIFWAKREDSETCSAKCFGRLRTKRYRTLTDEEKAERKAQREANKKYKIKVKEIKEKKNGTL